jgi:type I restriction enzyme, S subunit
MVKPGYKQTEVGVIPEDWVAEPLGKLTLLMTNGFVGTATRHYTDEGKGVRYIHGYNVIANSFDFHGVKFVDESFHRAHLKSCLRAGDVLTVQTGDVGLTTVVTDELAGSNCHALIISRFDQKKASPRFVSFYLNSGQGRSRLKLIEIGTTMKHLNVGDMLQFSVPLPSSLPEQQAIASALSDADELIESLEQLLTKKRQIKQGAMQELLTGKKRLPGFSGEWELKKLGDLGEVTGSGVDKKNHEDEIPVRLVNYMDVYRRDFIHSKDLNHWVTAPSHKHRRCAVQRGDIFFTPSSETRDDIAHTAVAMEDIADAVYSYHVVRLRLSEEWDLKFRTYAFKTHEFMSQAETICDGGGTRYVISLGKFRELTVSVPSLPEQTAIAEVLSDMDAEIEALETKLSKARLVKQGMMQELLTGRIRLV